MAQIISQAQRGFREGIFSESTSTALATAALTGLTAHAQETADTRKAEQRSSSSDPGQENRPLLEENPNSNMPPPTDHGDIGPIWYSFDLVHKRVQDGGWTHEVNSKVLPTLKGSDWRKHAAYGGQLPRIALAHRR